MSYSHDVTIMAAIIIIIIEGNVVINETANNTKFKIQNFCLRRFLSSLY